MGRWETVFRSPLHGRLVVWVASSRQESRKNEVPFARATAVPLPYTPETSDRLQKVVLEGRCFDLTRSWSVAGYPTLPAGQLSGQRLSLVGKISRKHEIAR